MSMQRPEMPSNHNIDIAQYAFTFYNYLGISQQELLDALTATKLYRERLENLTPEELKNAAPETKNDYISFGGTFPKESKE